MTTTTQYYPQTVSHPGTTLVEILGEKQMGSKEFAVRTGKPEKTISDVLNGKSGITPEMAILFEQVLKIPAHFWINRQRTYDEYLARVEYKKTIEEGIEWIKTFPYAKMASLGWVEPTLKKEVKVINLYNYFGVSNIKGYYDFYHHQKLLVNFRISLKNNENSGAIAAWLRQGEIESCKLDVPKFDKKKLIKLLPELKMIMAFQPNDFFSQIQNLCMGVGLKVVHTPCLPKAPIHGSTRWLGDIPLIQLSGRYKRNDIFWFTFFHEIGHILLHGKKYIAIENIKYDGENQIYEEEANKFSANLLLSKEQEAEILSNRRLSEGDIINYAEKFNTHPAIIIGRLQYLKLVPFGLGNNLFNSIDFCS
ncbi:addiction module antidote protein, HigA family [Lutibacter agarilyticus]|uniref:Addiction module antidote protein, HigA family n=1 Tax=Lutibacter agarilyticus TaxID=1109740 RepID=A0A238W0G9_9FLAO|nr:ImmA/IrrE family metallo-endopeptidase [Lutibacter agarilyticus]SNR39199.1 addiction module antidote protein, HigA family [Lutibacter agarilyticus]